MARPSRSNEDLLEALETISAALAIAGHQAAVLNVRLRAVRRRVCSQASLYNTINPAMEQLAELTDSLQLAQGTLHDALAAMQRQRNQANRKRNHD